MVRVCFSLCLFILFCSVSLLHCCGAIFLEVPPSGTKCISEEIHNNVVVLAEYATIPDEFSHESPTIGVKVTSPYGNNLHDKENLTTGHFAFTTSEAGNYLACFWLNGPKKDKGATVNLDWRIGIAARDWESVAKKDKIEGVELELRKLESAVESIHENLIYLKTRESEMREVSERTNARVAWLSIASLSVCIVVSVLQILYLKRYFLKKKLI